MTYEEFVTDYKRVNRKYGNWWLDLWHHIADRRWYGIAFQLRIRVPDALGFYGPGTIGAGWTVPWRWYRRYYEARCS